MDIARFIYRDIVAIAEHNYTVYYFYKFFHQIPLQQKSLL